MTYRPRSSVTTIFTNFVGSWEVSAITHTPASGPFALVTTPAISFSAIWTCWLDSSGSVARPKEAATSVMQPNATRLKYRSCFFIVSGIGTGCDKPQNLYRCHRIGTMLHPEAAANGKRG